MTATALQGTAKRLGGRVTPHKGEQALFELTPPLVRDGETHSRVIVAAADGETHVFPTFGRPRVLVTTTPAYVAGALRILGYEVAS